MTMAVEYSLILGSIVPPTLFFIKTAVTIWGLLWFHVNFWNICSSSVKYVFGVLIGIVLNLWISLGSMDKQQALTWMWRKGNIFALLVGTQIGAATVESSMKIPQKIKNGSAYWPSSPTSGNISKGTQNTNLKKHKHPMRIAALATIAKTWKQTKCSSVDEWIKQWWDIYMMDYYLAVKRKFYPL